MKHKKKFYFILLLVAFIVAHGVASWWVGEQAQQISTQQVSYLNKQLERLSTEQGVEQSVQLELDTVKRGVWSSERYLTVTWFDGKRQQRYVLEDNLQHGPWPWALIKKGQWKPVIAFSQMHLLEQGAGKNLYDWALGKTPLLINTEINWGGQFNSHWEWVALVNEKSKEPFTLGAGSLEIHSIGQSRYQLQAQAPAFSLSYQGEELRFIEPEIKWLSTNPNSLYDGQVNFKALSFEWRTETLLQAEHLDIEVVQHSQDGYFDLTTQADLRHVVIDRGILLGNFALRMQLERFAQSVAAQTLSSNKPKTKDEKDALWLQKLAEYPKYTVESFIWENDGGKATLSGFVTLAPRLGDELDKAALEVNLPSGVLKNVIGQEKGVK